MTGMGGGDASGERDMVMVIDQWQSEQKINQVVGNSLEERKKRSKEIPLHPS